MNDNDLPYLFVVFDEDGAPCHVDLDERNAHAHINDAGADGIPVRDWIVRKYLPARKYGVA